MDQIKMALMRLVPISVLAAQFDGGLSESEFPGIKEQAANRAQCADKISSSVLVVSKHLKGKAVDALELRKACKVLASELFDAKYGVQIEEIEAEIANPAIRALKRIELEVEEGRSVGESELDAYLADYFGEFCR